MDSQMLCQWASTQYDWCCSEVSFMVRASFSSQPSALSDCLLLFLKSNTCASLLSTGAKELLYATAFGWLPTYAFLGFIFLSFSMKFRNFC